jgi:plastocyanin
VRAVLVVGLTALVLAAAGCVSERSNATGPSSGSCSVSLSPSQFGSTVVAIDGFAFAPTPVRVRPGGKVTWVNCEPVGTPAHTSTADGGKWSSAPLEPGITYTVTFDVPGTFVYHCEPHPFMTGEVIVE